MLCPVALDCLDCLPVILRLPGNTSAVNAGRHGIGSRSCSMVSPPASYPLRFCIFCSYCSAPLPRVVSSVPRLISSVPLSACFILIAPSIASCSPIH